MGSVAQGQFHSLGFDCNPRNKNRIDSLFVRINNSHARYRNGRLLILSGADFVDPGKKEEEKEEEEEEEEEKEKENES